MCKQWATTKSSFVHETDLLDIYTHPSTYMHGSKEGPGTRNAAEPLDRVTPIMVTHCGNYGLNYDDPKAKQGQAN